MEADRALIRRAAWMCRILGVVLIATAVLTATRGQYVSAISTAAAGVTDFLAAAYATHTLRRTRDRYPRPPRP